MFRNASVAALTILAIAILIGIGGCAPASEPVIWTNNGRGWIDKAPQEGEYALNEACHDGGSQFQGLTVHLHSAEPLGFEAHGPQLEAIAGSKRFELPPGKDYVWTHPVSGFNEFMRGAVYAGMGVVEVIALPIEIPLMLAGFPSHSYPSHVTPKI